MVHLPSGSSRSESSNYWGSSRGRADSRRNVAELSLNELKSVSSRGAEGEGRGGSVTVAEGKKVQSNVSLV